MTEPKPKYHKPRIIYGIGRLPDVWPKRILGGRPCYGAEDMEWVLYLLWLEGFDGEEEDVREGD